MTSRPERSNAHKWLPWSPNISGPFEIALWLSGVLTASLLFWKFRIVDSAYRKIVMMGNQDLFTEHYPMTKFGFDRLFSGDLPLWNPYELTGMPFLAVSYVGLFYPGNFIYGFLDIATAIEVSFVLHLFIAGAGMWMLLRTLEFSGLAGFVAAITFMWSGWMVHYSNQASLVSGMSWLPFTIWMVELTARGRRRAGFALVAAVSLQLFNGATEFLVYNMYLSGSYAAIRLVEIGLRDDWLKAVKRGATLLACVAAGILLAAPQLLPSIALAETSSRAELGLQLNQALQGGTLSPVRFAEGALMATSMVAVGVLPFLGLVLGSVARRLPLFLWCFLTVFLSSLMVFGGDAYALYFSHTPFGDLFRRPNKFIHMYAFAQAIMAALAVLALEQRLRVPRLALLRGAAFSLSLVFMVGSAVWATHHGLSPLNLWLLISGVVLFVLCPQGKPRVAIIVGLVALQGVTMFRGPFQIFVRPAAMMEAYHEQDDLLDHLESIARNERIHIVPDAFLQPALMQKVGLLRGMHMLGGYSPFVSRRAAAYFKRVNAQSSKPERGPTSGKIIPGPDSDWRLLDMTSTRFYVVRSNEPYGPGKPVADFLSEQAMHPIANGVMRLRKKSPQIYKRANALPRAYYVGGARSAANVTEALDVLQSEEFRPRFEVVLEGAPELVSAAGKPRGADPQAVELLEQRPEFIRIGVNAPASGFVVLTEAYDEGWAASVDGKAAPVLIANALFRAVPVPAGRSVVEMEFRSLSFERGVMISAVTALLLIVILWRMSRREERQRV